MKCLFALLLKSAKKVVRQIVLKKILICNRENSVISFMNTMFQTSNEIVLRRLAVDRSASRLRSAFEDVEWQLKLTQWLHTVLMENLPTSLLACYLDIIQTLRSKVSDIYSLYMYNIVQLSSLVDGCIVDRRIR